MKSVYSAGFFTIFILESKCFIKTAFDMVRRSHIQLQRGMTNYPIGPHRNQIGPNRAQFDPIGPLRTVLKHIRRHYYV